METQSVFPVNYFLPVPSIIIISMHLGRAEPGMIMKRACLTGSQFLEGVAGKEGWPFLGGCSFYVKNKLKLKTLNDKKNYKQKYFSVIIKNLNWEILSTNLVIFKRSYRVKDEKILILCMEVHWKIWFLWGVHKKPYLPKKGGLESFQI